MSARQARSTMRRGSSALQLLWAAFALGALGSRGVAADLPAAAAPEALKHLSLEELANVEVTSASKSNERLSEATAALYVISHDDIVRAGVQSIPEALRLAPNLQVTQLTSSNYVVTARGFGGSPPAQNFANKLLVLIDGRSVYTPLFSGVYYDAQDVILDDVARIEVISGPGATLWGANAMNGVINIITRAAADTRGVLLAAGGGNLEKNLSLRYGGKLNDATDYRVYTKFTDNSALELADGASAQDAWSKAQGGFRIDWGQGLNTLTLQGDAYRATEDYPGTGDGSIAGVNVLGRWQHTTERSQLQVQAYVDQTQRRSPAGGGAFVLHTYDIEVQDSLTLGSHQRVVVGIGERINDYGITNSQSLLFLPEHRALTLGNIFAQDTISIGAPFKLTLGIKLEDDPFSGWTALPDARASWSFNDRSLLWAAASKAIRSPTPFDHDVVEKLGGQVFLTGNAAFDPERVSAYEIGYRAQPAGILSFSVSGFYNVYHDLRTIEPAPITFIPLRWDNLMQGDTYGLEAWSTVQVTDWWRLSPGVRWLHKTLSFSPGASGILGIAQAGDDSSTQASIRSSMDLGRSLTFDASLQHVSSLPSPVSPGYYDLTVRLGWRLSRGVDLSISGFNLTHARHNDFAAPDGEAISRSFIAEGRFSF